jgi:hypothetical protein
VIDTELQQTEIAAFQAQALIEKARRLHRRRQRRVVSRLIAAVLLIGIAASAIALSISRSPHSTTTLPRFGGPTTPTNNTAYITSSEGVLRVSLASKKVVGRITPHGRNFALDPIAIAPGGRTAYVVSDNIFTAIDLVSDSAMTPITLGSATGETAEGVSVLDRHRSEWADGICRDSWTRYDRPRTSRATSRCQSGLSRRYASLDHDRSERKNGVRYKPDHQRD